MQILIDYRPALRERTGAGEYIHQLALAVAAELQGQSAAAGNRDRLTLFSSSFRDRLPALPADVEVVDRRIPVRTLNLLWHRFEWPGIERLTGRAFDVVHSPHPLLLPARGAAQLVTIHDLDFLAHPERTRGEVRRDYPALAPDHARRADAVIVPSRYTARRVQQELHVPSDRIAICPPGAPPWRAREAGRPGRHVLFVGTAEPRKNLPTLLEVYRHWLSRRHDAPDLVLAGRTGPASSGLQAAPLGALGGKIRHLGYVSDQTRQMLFDEAVMLVLPSLDEGFGMPALEAMAAGVPVVASNRGALPELLGGAGLLVDPEDPSALEAAMERLVAEPGLARRLAEEGVRRARSFSWTSTAREVVEVYRTALERKRRGVSRRAASA